MTAKVKFIIFLYPKLNYTFCRKSITAIRRDKDWLNCWWVVFKKNHLRTFSLPLIWHTGTQTETDAHTHTHLRTALSSRVLSCLANAVQIEGAIHLLTVPKSKGRGVGGGVHVGQTNSQPWVTQTELISHAWVKSMHTHITGPTCNDTRYLSARASGCFVVFF